LRALLRNWIFWVCIGLAVVASFAPCVGIPLPHPTPWGATVLGVLVGALFASVTLVLGMVLNAPAMAIREADCEHIDAAIPTLKLHVELILWLFFLTVLIGVWPEGPYDLLSAIIHNPFTLPQFSFMLQTACLLLAACSIIELTRGTFLLLQSKWELTKRYKSRRLQGALLMTLMKSSLTHGVWLQISRD